MRARVAPDADRHRGRDSDQGRGRIEEPANKDTYKDTCKDADRKRHRDGEGGVSHSSGNKRAHTHAATATTATTTTAATTTSTTSASPTPSAAQGEQDKGRELVGHAAKPAGKAAKHARQTQESSSSELPEGWRASWSKKRNCPYYWHTQVCVN